MASSLLHPKNRWLLYRVQGEAWSVWWPQPTTSQQLLCRRSVVPSAWLVLPRARSGSVVMFCSLVLQSKLTCVCALCRMSADEDRATQAQYVCHPMPAVDLGYWTNFPRRQQWGKVNGWNFVLRLCDKDAVTVHLWQIIQSNHRSFQFEHHSKKYTYQSLRFLLMQNFPIIYIDISIYLYIYIKHCREWILKNLLINRKPWIKLIATNYYLKIISMWNHIPNC